MFLYLENRFNKQPSMVLIPKPLPGIRYVEYIGAPVYFLPKNRETLKREKKSKYWYNVSRMQQKFIDEHGELKFSLIWTVDVADEWLKQVHSLFLQRWSETYISSEWQTDDGFSAFRKAFLDLMSTDESSLAVLHSNGKLLAFSCNLHAADRFYFFQHATVRDPQLAKYSLGKIFLVNLIEELVDLNRFNIFDFMIGESPYKMEWASCVQKIYLRLDRSNYARFGYYKTLVRWEILGLIQRYPSFKGFLKKLTSIFRKTP